MPFITAPKPPSPNRQEGERPAQLVDRGTARMHAASWRDQLRDLLMPLRGDPASDAMGLAGPMQLPGALGLGIVKTAGPKALLKVGRWGRGPANEALEYLAAKFPRIAQQVEFLMDDTLGPGTSARWSPDNYLPYRADLIAEGEARGTSKAGKIKLNPMIHRQGQGVDDSVNSIAHEMQHTADNLRQPQMHDPAYKQLNISPFSYEQNPYENLANITGATEQAGWLRQAGKRGADEVLEDWAGQLRGRFPDNVRDVVEQFLPKIGEDPASILRALRYPNRALASMAERAATKSTAGSTKAWDQFNKAVKSPDALRKAILQRKR